MRKVEQIASYCFTNGSWECCVKGVSFSVEAKQSFIAFSFFSPSFFCVACFLSFPQSCYHSSVLLYGYNVSLCGNLTIFSCCCTGGFFKLLLLLLLLLIKMVMEFRTMQFTKFCLTLIDGVQKCLNLLILFDAAVDMLFKSKRTDFHNVLYCCWHLDTA